MSLKLSGWRLHALAAVAVLMTANAVQAAESSMDAEMATLARIREAAMSSNFSYDRLEELTDRIGPRLSGSPGAAAAVNLVADDMRAIGMDVKLQPAKVPHWVRGAEAAELVDYPHCPQGLTQRITLTTLGGSSATPAGGITAPVVVVHNFDELHQKAAQIKGAIVLYDVPFDQGLAEDGQAGTAYTEAGMFRFGGPVMAAKLGAAAALVRSVGGANYRLPHTGATSWRGTDLRIPAAAVTAEDAMLMARLAAQGPIKMHLTLTPQTLPDVDSFNVLADLPGSDKAEEVVLVSGHLDSWDLAQGATDDGAGLAAAMGVADVFKKLGLKPRRTVRVVAWMNEENGQRGARAYQDAVKDKINSQFAAIESDGGAGRPLGFMSSVMLSDEKLLDPLRAALRSIEAPVIKREERLGSGDLSDLEDAGVPSFEPLVDMHSYFNYHHTAADTLDKVEPDNLKRQVALLAMLTWYLAEMPESLQRLPQQKETK
jgi:hypothetical protein